jgi:hypothetical protein
MRDIGIQKPGYRNRILSKLQEEQQNVAHKPDIVMETTSNSTACEMCRLM